MENSIEIKFEKLYEAIHFQRIERLRNKGKNADCLIMNKTSQARLIFELTYSSPACLSRLTNFEGLPIFLVDGNKEDFFQFGFKP